MSTEDMSELEAIRLKNLADNKAVLAKMMEEWKDMAPYPIKKKPVERRRHKPRRITEPITPRRNPTRSTRNKRKGKIGNSHGRTLRFRRGSVSSVVSDASSEASTGRILVVKIRDIFKPALPESDSSESEDEFQHYDKYERIHEWKKKRRATAIRARVIKSAEDITEEDLQNVCDYAGDKHWDSELGTSCHQCRQKTDDQKTICRADTCIGVRGQFCGPCLRNRYGEDAREALKNPKWACPPCRGICNCSFCRRKSGKSCTGILIHLARDSGYEDVNSYLQSFKTKNANTYN